MFFALEKRQHDWTKASHQNGQICLEPSIARLFTSKRLCHGSLYTISTRSIYKSINGGALEVLTGRVVIASPFSTSTAGTGTWTAIPGTGHSWPALLGGANLRQDGSLLALCKVWQMYIEIKIVLIKLNFSHWKEYKILVSVLKRCRPMDNTIQIILTCDNIHQKKQCKGKGLASKVSLMNR